MKYYYEDKWVKIIHGDCREVLPQLDVKVDLVLTDFPYGNNTNYGSYEDTQDNLKTLVGSVMPLLKTERTLITCGVGNISLYPKPDWILAWVTPAGSGSSKWGFCCWQPILAYGSDPYLQNGMGRRADIFIKTEVDNVSAHPCSKPVDLWQMVMLRGSVKTTDTILDPFLGSGTTCYCAKKLNRYSIGIEIEEKYCEIAAKRCMQIAMELDIPQPPQFKETNLELQL